MFVAIVTRLRGLLQRRRVAREVDDELRFHLEMETDANVKRGLPEGEARRMALLDLGGLTRTKEAIRDVRSVSLESIWQDARFALRGMRKRLGFTTLVVTTLAAGIGVNAASLAVAYGILGRPLPYADAPRIVILNLLFFDGGDLGFSPKALHEWLSRLHTVEVAAGYRKREVTVRAGARSTVVPAAFVTERFFDVLGTPAEVGRARPRVDSPELIVSRRALDRVFGGSTASESVGTLVSVSDQGYVVSGVMPSEFSFPDDEIALWLPSQSLTPGATSQSAGYSKIIARLKPGVTLQQMRDEADRVRLELNPKSRELISVSALGESVVTGMRRLLVTVVAGAFLVLLVACANVATLFIGRDVAREREFAARLALGATRYQLVRATFVETLLIALTASVCGVGVGVAALKFLMAEASTTIPGLHRVQMDLPIALAIATLTIVVTLICGSAPAWHLRRNDISPFSRPTAGARPRAWQVRRALVIVQIALSCVLLVGAGLLLRTVSALLHEDHGFRPDGAVEAKVVLSDIVLLDSTPRADFVGRLLDRLRALPGVEHVGFGSNLPPRTPPITIAIRLVVGDRDETRFMKVGSATPGYLRALGVRFLAGRDFDDGDARPDAASVILSESAGQFHFPGVDPIGRTIPELPSMFNIAGAPRVIGVVSDIKYEGLDSPAGSALYLPWSRRPLGQGYVIVRSTGDPMRLAPEIRRTAQMLDPTVPVLEVQSLEDALAQSIAQRRVRVLPAIGFGLLALALACIGVLATLTTFVAERRRDLAIRAALGASPTRLMRTILAQGLVLTGVGLVVGVGLGRVAAGALSSLVYGVGPYDAMTFIGTVLLISAGATLTTYIAAVRARGADPLVLLRYE